VVAISAAEAESGVPLDLDNELLAGATRDGVWAATLDSPGCTTVVATPTHGVDLVDVHTTPARLWWAFSTAADFGGSVGEFGRADVGPGCAVTSRVTLPATVFPPLDWATGTFAVDASTLYTAGAASAVDALPLPQGDARYTSPHRASLSSATRSSAAAAHHSGRARRHFVP
jgi:hypothetical protein